MLTLRETAPAAPAQFSAFDFSARPTIVAAVSGGSDSTALLLLLKAHLDREAPQTRLVVVTVDHRLRPEAAGEAEAVGRFCAAQGIAHRIAAWTEPKPGSGLQEAAREARHRLLAASADEFGTDIVVTGHTRDDLLETVLMRHARGGGLGLAGIAPATLHDRRVWFVRPLLGTRRDTLRSFLASGGVAWIDDPGNEDRRFERVRVREELAARSHADREAIAEHAAAAAIHRRELGERAAELIARHAERVSPGLLRLSRDVLTGDRDAAVHAFRVLAASAGGAQRLPDEPRSSELFARLAKIGERATLAGAVVTSRRDGIYLHREFRGQGPQPARLEPGMVWDGRYEAAGSFPPDLSVAPVGRQVAAEAGSPAGVPRGLASAARAAEPRLFDGTKALSEAEAGTLLRPVVAPFARYLPCFDLAVAQAAANLLGASPFPAPPFRVPPRMGHNRLYA